METLRFILSNLPMIGERTVEHISIVSVAVGIAILVGVPTGIAITRSQRIADTVLYLGSIVMTIYESVERRRVFSRDAWQTPGAEQRTPDGDSLPPKPPANE